MFGWILKLFRRNPDNCLLPPCEQSVVHYWDGQRNVIGDAEKILQSLLINKDCDLELDWKKAQLPMDEILGMTEALAAFDRLAGAARKAFGIKSVSEGGLTDRLCAILLINFMKHLESEKKNIAPLLIFAKPTAEQSLAGSLPEPSCLDSTSVALASSPAEPPASHPASV